MSGLCGWVGESREGADAIMAAMVNALVRFDRAPCLQQSGHRHRFAVAAPADWSSAGIDDEYAAALWGKPEFVDPQLASTAREKGAAKAVIDAIRRFGPEEGIAKLGGAFALALVNDANGEALLAIDRMGVHNLVYAQVGASLVFGSTADAVHCFPGTAREIDWQSIYHYVHFHMVPAPATAFQHERRLLPGQYLHLRAGNVRLAHYWRMRFVEDENRPFHELQEEFLSTLTESVRRTSPTARTGAFLSGGTDSSTVSGLLGKVTEQPANTFSIGFAERGYDEMEYARIASRHFETRQHEYYVTPADIVDAIPKLAAIFDQPFGNSSAVPTFCCAKFARETGMDVLLGGDGGDELFGGNERYATQYRYSIYQKLPDPLRKGMLEPLARHFPGAGIFPPIRWYRRLVDIASTPMPDRMDAHNLLLRLGAESVFVPDLLQKIDCSGPQRLMREIYGATDAGSLINKMLGLDFRITLSDSDLPKVMKSCELAGIAAKFPMLDDRLVAFSAKLAPSLKLNGTKLRYFFKEALRGFLPPQIIAKTKHGFGLPFGRWIREHKPLEELVVESLRGLQARGIVQSEFLNRLMGAYLREHSDYYGTMVWVLMMLELWFRKPSQQP